MSTLHFPFGATGSLRVTALFLLLSSGSGRTASAGQVYFDTLYDQPAPEGILDGTPRTFVVSGYSTSIYPDPESNWPAVLQRMLDEHAGGARMYHVYNEAVGGSPIAVWTAMCSKGSGGKSRDLIGT